MSVLPTTAHDVARRVELGQECAHCSEPFVKAHGSPTACSHCFRRLSADERGDTPLAVHEEATKAQYANEARKRKAKRNA